MFLSAENIHMWVWATKFPYLFTLICLGTPSVTLAFMYLCGRVFYNMFKTKK